MGAHASVNVAEVPRLSSGRESGATLGASEIESIAGALASVDMRDAVLRTVERIASQRFGMAVFSASVCRIEAMEVERVHSSRPEVYPVGSTTNKRDASWGRQVLKERQVFVGEGALEMAAAFDDQEGMARAGVRSIINVPIVLKDSCLGVLNFGLVSERVTPLDVCLARMLAIAASAAFATPPADRGAA